jgi:hypothetical protein
MNGFRITTYLSTCQEPRSTAPHRGRRGCSQESSDARTRSRVGIRGRVQDIPGGDLQSMVPGACHQAAGSHWQQPAIRHCCPTCCRSAVPMPRRRSCGSTPNAPARHSSSDVPLHGTTGRECQVRVAVLGQHPGRQGKCELETRLPWLDAVYLHRQPGTGVSLIHLAIMPLADPGRSAQRRQQVRAALQRHDPETRQALVRPGFPSATGDALVIRGVARVPDRFTGEGAAAGRRAGRTGATRTPRCLVPGAGAGRQARGPDGSSRRPPETPIRPG